MSCGSSVSDGGPQDTTLDGFPSLLAIAIQISTAPVAKLKADRFFVSAELFKQGYLEAYRWGRTFGVPFYAGDINQQNFIWRGIPIVAETAA